MGHQFTANWPVAAGDLAVRRHDRFEPASPRRLRDQGCLMEVMSAEIANRLVNDEEPRQLGSLSMRSGKAAPLRNVDANSRGFMLVLHQRLSNSTRWSVPASPPVNFERLAGQHWPAGQAIGRDWG